MPTKEPLSRRLAKSAARILVVPVALYVALAALMYSKQEELLFFPDRAHAATPAKQGLAFEDAAFTSKDGTKLHGWFVPAVEAPRATVLHCHGNGGNISYLATTVGMLHDRGFATLVFDYRNYGKSGEGAWSERALYEDAEAAWTWLTATRGVDRRSIVLWGQSMGGGVCSWLAKEKGAKALVLDSTFTSLPDVAADLYWYMPVRLLSRFRFPTIERLPELTMPVAIAHASDDDLVPIGHARRNLDALRGRKLFVELRGGHNDGFDLTPGAMDRVTDFVAESAP